VISAALIALLLIAAAVMSLALLFALRTKKRKIVEYHISLVNSSDPLCTVPLRI
jgi:hypothetical protein